MMKSLCYLRKVLDGFYAGGFERGSRLLGLVPCSLHFQSSDNQLNMPDNYPTMTSLVCAVLNRQADRCKLLCSSHKYVLYQRRKNNKCIYTRALSLVTEQAGLMEQLCEHSCFQEDDL